MKQRKLTRKEKLQRWYNRNYWLVNIIITIMIMIVGGAIIGFIGGGF